MADYKRLLDSEIWTFIEKTAQFYPAETASFGIEEQRRIYDEMCAAFAAGYPQGVKASDRRFGDVPCRHYSCKPECPAWVMYFHGGGFVVGGLESHDDVCAELCKATGCDVVSVDYRLSPEHKHPAAFDDASAASHAVFHESGKPLILCGDSAGGTLAAALTQSSRHSSLPVLGQVLIYPGLGGEMQQGSYIEHAHAPMLTLAEVEFYKDVRLSKKSDEADPSYAPLQDSTFTNMPPTIAFAAQYDPLCDDVKHYEDHLRAAGCKVQTTIEPGLVHGHLRARHISRRASECFDKITQAIIALSRQQWPVPFHLSK